MGLDRERERGRDVFLDWVKGEFVCGKAGGKQVSKKNGEEG